VMTRPRIRPGVGERPGAAARATKLRIQQGIGEPNVYADREWPVYGLTLHKVSGRFQQRLMICAVDDPRLLVKPFSIMM